VIIEWSKVKKNEGNSWNRRPDQWEGRGKDSATAKPEVSFDIFQGQGEVVQIPEITISAALPVQELWPIVRSKTLEKIPGPEHSQGFG
jgi:hypothetical protein